MTDRLDEILEWIQDIMDGTEKPWVSREYMAHQLIYVHRQLTEVRNDIVRWENNHGPKD